MVLIIICIHVIWKVFRVIIAKVVVNRYFKVEREYYYTHLITHIIMVRRVWKIR